MTQRTKLSAPFTAATVSHCSVSFLSRYLRSGIAGRVLLVLCLFAGMGAAVKARTAKFFSTEFSLGQASYPDSIAVDQHRNVFFTQFNGNDGVNELWEIPRGCNGNFNCEIFLNHIYGFSNVDSIAADAQSNLYVVAASSDFSTTIVKIIPFGCTSAACVTTVAGSAQFGTIALGGSGNIYDLIYDYTTQTSGVQELPAGCASSSCIVKLGGSFPGNDGPNAIAADPAGNVYVTEPNNDQNNQPGDVKKIPAGCTTDSCVITIGGDYFAGPFGVTADANGNAYITDTSPDQEQEGGWQGGFFRVSEIPAGCIDASCIFSFPVSTNQAEALSVDASGDYIAVADTIGQGIEGITRGTAVFPTTAVGSSAITVNFNFIVNFDSVEPTSGVGVSLTAGATNLDFSNDTFSCGYSFFGQFTQQQFCSADVTFTPTQPGLREGSVQLKTANGTVIATEPLSGIGVAPQVVFGGNHVHTAVGGGFLSPQSVAIDGKKDLFVADAGHNAVKEIPVGCSSANCAVSLGGGFASPSGVAVDGSGDVLVADTGNDAVKEIPAGCTTAGCVVTLAGRFSSPAAVVLDPFGDVIVADAGDGAVKEIPAGCASSNCVTTVAGGFSDPSSLVVDGAGDIFVADTGNNAVKEIPLGCTATGCVVTLGGNFSSPSGVAVDAAGDVFIADAGNHEVEKMAAGCTSANCVTSIGGGYSSLAGVLFDGTGNLYVAAPAVNSVFELNFTTALPVSFDATAPGQTSGDGPRTVTVTNDGNGPLTFSAITVPANFAVDLASTCTSTTTVNAGGTCAAKVDFTPTGVGTFTGSLVLTDNNLNANPSVTQSVALSGNGVTPSVATPTFTEPSGKYVGSVSVMLSDSTSNAVIHYTVDGSTPTAASPVYSQTIDVTAYTMVQAVAIVAGGGSSPVASATYEVTQQTPAPTIRVASGQATITDSVAATIRYTTDGSAPTSTSKLYTGPITVTGPETINAIAISTGKAESDVATATVQ